MNIDCQDCGYEAEDLDDAVAHVYDEPTHHFTIESEAGTVITISMGD